MKQPVVFIQEGPRIGYCPKHNELADFISGPTGAGRFVCPTGPTCRPSEFAWDDATPYPRHRPGGADMKMYEFRGSVVVEDEEELEAFIAELMKRLGRDRFFGTHGRFVGLLTFTRTSKDVPVPAEELEKMRASRTGWKSTVKEDADHGP